MKVLIATGLYPPEIGGPATYCLLLEEELPKRGIDISVLPFGLVRHHPKLYRHLVYSYKLWQMSKKVDIIYALDPVSVGLPAWLVATLRRKKFVIRLGGDYAWEQGVNRFGLKQTLDEYIVSQSKAPLRVRQMAAVQSFVTKRADRVVAPSNYLKSIISKWGVEPENISVIYSALYPLIVEGRRDELRQQLDYTFPTLVTAGRLVPWKGISTLLEVVQNLKATYPNIELVVIGDGEEEASLKAKAYRLGINDQVRFVGRLSKDALGASIKAADVFVLNTAYEGLSHQLIEVMDIGTPIVTTTAGGNPELITDTVSGYLVEFNNNQALQDAVTRVLDYPDSRERITQSARGRSHDFSKENMLANIEKLLHLVHGK